MKFVYPTASLLAYYFVFALASPRPPPTALLPPEKDGVSPSPAGNTIYFGDSSSCWTKPEEPAINGMYPIANGGTCRVCVVQNGTGEDTDYAPSYELWVRDDKNHAIGGIDPFTMAPWPGPPDDISHPPNPVSFAVGAKLLNMWSSLPNERSTFVTVYMVWDKPAGWNGPETMRYDTDTITMAGPSKASNNCTLSGDVLPDAITFFQCQFNC